ncbi:MAG: ATP-binding cassette domain-containing protein [Pseudomonadota bacterium]
MLEFLNVNLRQGDFHLSASFSVEAPGIVAVIGPSGAGKSTLLAAVSGFLPPDGGDVLWLGESLIPLSPGSRPVTTVFQDQNLFPHLTAFQNVGLGLSPRLKLSSEDRGAVEDALAQVGLAGLGTRRPAELSGGQAGRVALARALVRARPIVCLDEPFSALGPSLRHEMLDLVGEVLSDALVLMVTHDPSDARRSAPRSIVVADGMAHAPKETAALLDDPPEALRSYLGAQP